MALDLQQQLALLTKACRALVSDVTELQDQGPVVGSAGPEGPEGQPGPAGVSGEPGLCGERGLQGTAGPSGSDGGDGERGPRGDIGSTGVAGLQGDRGKPGALGAKGDMGLRGPKGDKGDMGKRGPKGDKGASVTRARLQGRDLIIVIDGKPVNVGRVVAPTPVFAGGGGGGFGGVPEPDPPVTVTEDYVVANSELIIIDATAQDINIDLSNPVRDKYKFKRKDGSGFTGGFGAAVIDRDTTFKLLSQDETVTLERDGLVWWIT